MRYHHLDLALKEIEQAGAKVDIEITKRNSIKLRISLNGKCKMVVASKTPSDFRVPMKIAQNVRQAIERMK